MGSNPTGGVPDFFASKKTWSEVKLRIWQHYVEAYLNVRGSSVSRISIIDGFSGQGTYGDEGGTRELGSPILVAREANQRIISGYGAKIRCVFVEADSSRYHRLTDAVSDFAAVDILVVNDKFDRVVPEILQDIGDTASITFLDPFGVEDIPFESLRPLLSKADSEFLINFSTPTITRLAGSAASDDKGAEAKRRLLSRVLGDSEDDPEWIRHWQGREDETWTKWVLDFYMRNLVNAGTELQYAVAYPVREALGSRPKYYLVFVSRHIKAIELMNDLLCSEEDVLFTGANGAPNQLNMFGSIRVLDRAHSLASRLTQQVHEFGCLNQGSSLDDIFRHFVTVQFAEFKKKHYRDALRQLEAAKKAERAGSRNDQTSIRFDGC